VSAPLLIRALSVPVVVAALLGGGWLTSAVITNDFTASSVWPS
jgi:hypothetical protein